MYIWYIFFFFLCDMWSIRTIRIYCRAIWKDLLNNVDISRRSLILNLKNLKIDKLTAAS